MATISEQKFSELLKSGLDGSWERALGVFHDYGPNLSYDVTNVLLHAVDQGKVDEVLCILEEHYKNHLQFQHPKIRGTVGNNFGINPTEEMFLGICKKTLGLQLSPV